MATYKVIQDIEAEDKLFGPLTLKQFIFACLTLLFGYLSFWSIINELWFLLIAFLPPTLVLGVLAFPYSKDQSTEVWLQAKLRFYFRPRRRIWDQSGIKQLVTITVPKKEEHIYTDGLSHSEIKSRLHALGDTLDSRGWAVKNATVTLGVNSPQAQGFSDRLVSSASQTETPADIIAEVRADDDIYDQTNNPTAHHLDEMIQTSEKQYKQQLTTALQQPQQDNDKNTSQNNDYWFMREHQGSTPEGTSYFTASQLVTPGQKTSAPSSSSPKDLTSQERAALEQIHKQKSRPNPMNSHLKTIKPLSEQKKEAAAKVAARKKSHDNNRASEAEASQDRANAAKMRLAQDDNLSVETIAKEARGNTGSNDEVVVSLHR